MDSPEIDGPAAETDSTLSPPPPPPPQTEDFHSTLADVIPPRHPAQRSASDPPLAYMMSASSSPLGPLNAARRPGLPHPMSGSVSAGLPQDMQAKMKAFQLSRQGAPPTVNLRQPSMSAISTGAPLVSAGSPSISGVLTGSQHSPSPTTPISGLARGMAGLRLPPNARPSAQNWASAPSITEAQHVPKPSLGARRGMKLPGGLPGQSPTGLGNGGITNAGLGRNPAESSAQSSNGMPPVAGGSLFSQFSNYVDTKTGSLKFAGKAVIHGRGVDFSSGSSFSISLDEVDNLEELGKGNYGTVYRVRHSRPAMRRPGQGLGGNRAPPSLSNHPSLNCSPTSQSVSSAEDGSLLENTPPAAKAKGDLTGIIMAMKEIRLELDEAKFAAIIMELDILHRCTSPFIIDFYGAFFQEGAVYICMEYMDGGSIDKLYGDGIPEGVLRKIALSTIMGLKSLKEDHNIIHRDVKPTNILANSLGQVKICDFGVSGNLVASIAKTNIGCQSYMAPERIASGGIAQAGANAGGSTYSVQSDIWSVGLSIIECAMGRYPYPPETYNNIFSQLSAIVDGEPPDLPKEGFSQEARDFVKGCLHKVPKLRPTYAMLLRHPWLAPLMKPPTIEEADEEDGHNEALDAEAGAPLTADKEVAAWVIAAIARRKSGIIGKSPKPALHAVPLDAVSPSIDKSIAMAQSNEKLSNGVLTKDIADDGLVRTSS
ncbi:MAG: hypothetical protein M1829_005172 [Trizodia sp. TS-e1964]|nr:MAG: hypothetical protein M1829_005172 [Trizodia sp. TS-e1964]